MKRIFLSLLLLACAQQLPAQGIKDSKHDLSSGSGSGGITSAEPEICIFCHTPHGSVPQRPLWNRYDSGSVYIPYTSSTIVAAPGQPDGDSVLCLSCHDGTIALGKIRSRSTEIPMSGGIGAMPVGSPGNLGTDLRDDHPISFVYETGPELITPVAPVRLDPLNKVQCSSCHQAHNDTNGQFLIVPNTQSALCVSCHQKTGWTVTLHRTADWPTATWGPGDSPPSVNLLKGQTVKEYGCENCHTPHAAASGVERLLYYADDANCSACHQAGNGVNARDIEAEFSKLYTHPQSIGVHDPAETAQPSSRHSNCVDCHNPHAASSGTLGSSPSGPLNQVRGVNSAGVEVETITHEYELCYRCHADAPVSAPSYPIDRMVDELNTRLEFDISKTSYHPVEGPGKNAAITDLISPLTASSIIKCTDCHNSEDSSVSEGPAGAGGSGPDGPHGSQYWPILIANYERTDRMTDINNDAAVCLKCHDGNTLQFAGGPDKFDQCHAKHLGDGITCIMCHDPHSADNAGLFNPVQGDPGVTSYTSFTPGTGGNSGGNCTMTCHAASATRAHNDSYADCN